MSYRLYATAAAAALIAGSAQAADSSAQLSEVIVTASRRAENVQDMPLAVTALGSEFLQKGEITSIEDAARFAPGLTLNKTSNFVQLNIRGVSLQQINLGGEPGVALHMDGVYIARPFASDAVLADLERVEVVRGPQGTLYGRNATGGSVNLVGKEPGPNREGRVGVSIGSYERLRAEGVFNTPLDAAGDWRLRASIVHDQRDGYVKNLLGGKRLDDQDIWSGRVGLAYAPGGDFEALIRADYTYEDDAGPPFLAGAIGGAPVAAGGRPPRDPRHVYLDGPHSNVLEAGGLSARLKWDLGSVTLTSLSAFRDSRFHIQQDLDGSSINFLKENLVERGKQYSQEFQLASDTSGPVRWIAGLYAFHEDGDLHYRFPAAPFGTTIEFIATQKTKSLAAFGEVTWDVTPALHATAGARYTYDEKTSDETRIFFVSASNHLNDHWKALTPKVSVSYDIDDDRMVYVSVSRGFKAGGINIGGLQKSAYDPEFVWSYEAGLKSRWFDRRLQLNVAAFHYDYSDLQVTQYAVATAIIDNAATATVNGLEFEVTARPTERLTLDATAAFLDAEFKDYSVLDAFRPTLGVLDLSGKALPRAPRRTFSFTAQYDVPMPGGNVLGLRGEVVGRSATYFTPFNTAFARDGAYALTNARISYGPEDGHWELAVFGRNLGDKDIPEGITVSGITASTLVTYAPPRTFGASLRLKF